MEKNVSDLFAALNESGVEVDKTLSRFGDDSSGIYAKFLKRFPDEDRITPIKDAVSENNLEKLSQTAHKLKGVSANLGMTVLSEAAHVLELKAKNGSAEGADEDIKRIEELNEEICRIIRENT